MVNREDVPDVVFLRSVVPVDGIEVMAAQWARQMPSTALANSQGKLCKSFAITSERYGADLCGDDLFLEDWGLVVSQERVGTGGNGTQDRDQCWTRRTRRTPASFVPSGEMAAVLEARTLQSCGCYSSPVGSRPATDSIRV